MTTLLVITFGVLVCFLVSGVVDHYRAKVLIHFGVLLDQRVSGHIFAALFELELMWQDYEAAVGSDDARVRFSAAGGSGFTLPFQRHLHAGVHTHAPPLLLHLRLLRNFFV